jgi:hypothetical protein
MIVLMISKRLATLIVVFISTFLIADAQPNISTAAHLTFKGVPVSGTLEEFVLKMKEAGFSHKLTKGDAALLEGEFASFKNCTILVSALRSKKLVSRVAVIFPNRDTWPSLSINYFTLKEMLTEKYGAPFKVVEEFQSYTPSDDGSKLTQVKLSACEYHTTFATDKGLIELSIDHDSALDCYVRLAYFDKINGVVEMKDALDDL